MSDTVKMILSFACCMSSAGLFISPFPTFRKILANRSVQHFRVDPYVASMLNCAFLIIYGVVNSDNKLVIFVNSVGLGFQIAYLLIFLYYADIKKKLGYWLGAAVAFFAAYSLVFLLALHDPKKKRVAFGVISTVFHITMYGFPLVILKKVIDTGSVEFMPLYLSVGLFVNSAVWLGYAAFPFDIYRMIGNGFGVLLSLLQIRIYCHYKSSDPVLPGAVILE
ncbi:bidirectional sugar transporter SWEET7b-like [Eucalyptus grandis]|uniref:bidirectional sugar transporter SWEET7b-like n=1 Tax=Eucalyptus grandis TaxID=71139 RepID=UPI00192EC7F6|nr:bidirectional sugar transporter SWEET7b-like [Eucalyptus grandis]